MRHNGITGRFGAQALKRLLSRPGPECGMREIFRRFMHDKTAATAIEYGLIAALIAVVIITGVRAVGTKLSTTFTTLSASLK
jgi:pilus assembly protein Flp/PilA